MTTETKHGRSAESILERGAGGEFHRAVALVDLESALYGVIEEFSYDTNEPAADLLRLARDLREYVERLSITDDAELTLERTCDCCGGPGEIGGVVCPDCNGTGALPSPRQEVPKEDQ